MKHSSEKDWNSIESTWRKKMQEEKSPVPAGVWEKLSDRLDAEEKPKVFFISSWPWAAVLVIGLGLSWLWLTPLEEEVSVSSNASPQSIAVQPSPIQPKGISKALALEERKVSSMAMAHLNVPQKLSQPTIEKNSSLREPTFVKEEIVQNPSVAANSTVEKVTEEEEALWLKVEIKPVVRTTEEEMERVAEVTPVKKRSFGQLIKKIKQVIKGNPGEWSELKENFHLVANKYVQTEETIKQKFQIQ